jgi:hypothetical protein
MIIIIGITTTGITTTGITTTDITDVLRTGKYAEPFVMTDAIGIGFAGMSTAMEDMEVIDHFVLPSPMDMATGMERGITVLLEFR